MPVSLPQRYSIIETLGSGASGDVWRVRDAASGRAVALKMLREPGLAGAGVGPAAESLVREFDLLRGLDHPGLVSVLDFGWAEGRPFYTMELCGGVEPARSGLRPPDPRFYAALASILRALHYLHSRGLVHGDLKPGNVRLTEAESVPQAVLLDFGLWRRVEDVRRAGTVEYMAPEVGSGMPADHRADLYSLGVILFEWVSGERPFRGDAYEVLRAHAFDRPPALELAAPGTAAALCRVVEALLEKEAARRPASANDVIARLNRDLGLDLSLEPGRVRPGGAARLPLVGRRAERELLREFLAGLGEGRGAAALTIEGPAGIGKSRLLDEVRAMAQLLGFHVCVARGPSPVAEWARAAGIDLGGTSGTASSVARLMRLHQRPGLFMADDVQQWDSAAREEAMAVARYVAADRESGGEWGGSAVVLAGRTDAGEWNMMLEGSPVLTRRISLGVLDEGEVGVFLREALRVDEVPQAISRAVASQTGGVPSLLVAASERLVEKIPAGQGVGPALQESVLGGLDLPRDVEASVIQRASGLRREARLVVIGCHLAGRSVTERALGAMLLTLDVSENPSALIGELDRGGWVVRDDGAVRVPALSGRTVAEQVGRDEIAAVATALARAMEAQGEAAERTMALDLVGGDVERARRAAVRVVEEGRGAGARERYRLLDLACRRGDLTSDRTLHVRLLEELAGAAIERGLFEEGRTRLQALAGEGDLQPEDRARVRVRLANAHRRCGDLMEAEKEYVAVLQGLDPGSALALEAESDLAVVEREEGRLARSIGRSEKLLQQSDERLAGFRGRVLRNLGAAISERGDHRKATELFRDAAAAYRGAGFGFEALVCDYSAATGLVRLGSFKTALRDLESILQACTEGDHALGVALSLQALGVSVIASGYPARGLDIAREAVRALSRLGNASELCRAWIDVAWAQSAMADFDEALAALDRSQLAAALGTSKRHAIQLPLLRGEVLARLGDCDGARAAIEEARRLASGDEALWSLEADVWAAWLDKAPGSQRVLEKALERFEAAENGWGAVLSRLLLAELLLREGAAGPVVEVLDGMGAQDDDSVLSSFGISRSRALLVRGRARTALGDAKGAESDFAECLATARDRLQRDEAWQGLARLGLLDLAAGRREQALVRLRSAVDSVRGITKMLCKQSGSLFMNDAERGKLLADVVSALAV